ncbi:hypothetical protein F2Q69_00014801 [Brassica cretica]|uniref:Uncharacterized protein n=1 Tax=Brassica cretica TaxID=69181 RepID=A0A8S9R9U2_BRACR|nr:hypothetical protein F2Q69_00014801 [Brassica cretica]
MSRVPRLTRLENRDGIAPAKELQLRFRDIARVGIRPISSEISRGLNGREDENGKKKLKALKKPNDNV